MRAFLVALVGALATAGFSQGYNTSTAVDPDVAFRSPQMNEIGVDQRLGQPIMGGASFIDDTGKKVLLKNLLGKRPTLILPIFYRCTGVCYLELVGAVDVLRSMPEVVVGRDLDVIALGINPTETFELARAKKAETLRTYGRKTDPKAWTFLTGDIENLQAVAMSLGFKYRYDKEKDQVSHPSGVMLVTADGTISSYQLGAKYQTAKFRELLALAKKGEVGQKSQTLFFGCIHIDPVTGKRSLMIQNVLRVLAVATVLGIASMLLVLNGRAHFRRRKSA